MRASNLVFISISPFVIYALLTARNYGAALRAVLGIEDNAPQLLGSFALFSITAALGSWGALQLIKTSGPDQDPGISRKKRKFALIAFALQAIALLALANLSYVHPYILSLLVNSFDPRTTEWIVIVNQSFTLAPGYDVYFLTQISSWLTYGAGLSAASALLALVPLGAFHTGWAFFLLCALFLVQFAFAFYIIMVAHAGFSVGLMVTLRAAVFAYLGASILGLIWTYLGKLDYSELAIKIFIALGVGLIVIGVFFANKQHDRAVLAGSLDGPIGIITGTPASIIDTVRFGEFLDVAPEKPFKVRSLQSNEAALAALDSGRISAAVLPADLAGDFTVIWQKTYLPPIDKTTATIAFVAGVMLTLLGVIGIITATHPLVVFSNFFVDTIRGIPMLVIILYVGLPLAGALKSASNGYLDLQMMTRGIIAIAIGYSAYMAEIFRAGIEAIPKGQIEAARTMGLREWHVARFIVVPQAIAIVLPALGNEFIAMLKDTSLVSILSVRDLTQRMREFQAQSFLAFEPFNSAALVYVLLTLIAASGIKALDRVVNKSRGNAKD
ncbi:MAG: polar amino acid transport system permease protein [Paracoccaceae bacterium]|jgi:polar amino acid transport system permease protein